MSSLAPKPLTRGAQRGRQGKRSKPHLSRGQLRRRRGDADGVRELGCGARSAATASQVITARREPPRSQLGERETVRTDDRDERREHRRDQPASARERALREAGCAAPRARAHTGPVSPAAAAAAPSHIASARRDGRSEAPHTPRPGFRASKRAPPGAGPIPLLLLLLGKLQRVDVEEIVEPAAPRRLGRPRSLRPERGARRRGHDGPPGLLGCVCGLGRPGCVAPAEVL